MAAQIKQGDVVQIVDREATPNDEKSNLFFNYFRNLTGTLEVLYDDGKASVVVDPESLPEVVLKRHQELTEGAKQKWLNGLSDEARNRLTPEEKQFQMRYSILVNAADLVKKGSKPAKPAATPSAKATSKVSTADKAGAPVLSREDLDKAEEEFLKARQTQKDK